MAHSNTLLALCGLSGSHAPLSLALTTLLDPPRWLLQGRHARAMADTQACLVADPQCQTCKTSTLCAICKDSTLPDSQTGKVS